MRDDGTRSLLGTFGSGALGIGLGLAILGLGFLVSRIALPDNVVEASISTPAASAVRSAASSARPATTAPSAAPTAATPVPSPTSDPMSVAAFQGQGLRLAAITIPAGYTFTAPIAGKVSISLYQYVNGEIRQGVADQPSYPYIFVRSADRELKLRPAAVDRDVQLLVQDGDTIAAGAALFKTVTTAPSSWSLFYDKSVTAQVVASAIALPSGSEVDPVPLFQRR